MNKTLRIIQIIIWSAVALILFNVLIASINNTDNLFSFFSLKNLINLDSSDYTISKDQTLSLEGYENIELKFKSADIRILSSENSQLRIIHKVSGIDKNKISFEVEKSDNTLRFIANDLKKSRIFPFGLTNRQKVDLYIPDSYANSMRIDNTSGDLLISPKLELDQFVINQVSGDVRLDSPLTAARAEITLVSGNINIKKLKAENFQLKTISGKININSLEGEGTVKTTSGDIAAEIGNVGELSTETVSGDIKIKLSDNHSYNIEARTLSGNISSDFSFDYKTKKEAFAKIGFEPYANLLLKTTSGDIKLDIDND